MKDILSDLGITESQLKKIISGKKYTPKIIQRHIEKQTFEFAIVSDTHLCSTEEKLDELHTFYEICRKEKIKDVLHAGDIICGWDIYRGMENEVKVFGAKNQVQYVIDNYPRVKGITTYFITGNHCLSWWKRSGIDIGELIAKERKDMVYLGQYLGDMLLNHIKVRLLHPDGMNAYALSYRGQKISEQIPSGQKPQIFILGHSHTMIYFYYRNIHIFQAGAFEGQTSFLLRKGINPNIGGWTVKVRVAKDKKHSIISLTPSWIPFF